MTVNSSTLPSNKCGTYAGWNWHKKQSEPVCNSCRIFKLDYDKEYRKNPKNLLRIQERDRMRIRNTEERLRTNETYRNNHKEELQKRSRSYQRKRRVMKKENGWEAYTEETVLEVYGMACYLCNKLVDLSAPRSTHKKGWQNGLHIDHVIPISKGGSDTLDNVRPTHALCNLSKNNKLIGDPVEDFEVEIDPSLFEDEDVELEDLDDLEDFEDDEEEEED